MESEGKKKHTEKQEAFFGNWKKYEKKKKQKYKTEEGKERRKKIMTYILVAYGRDSM